MQPQTRFFGLLVALSKAAIFLVATGPAPKSNTAEPFAAPGNPIPTAATLVTSAGSPGQAGEVRAIQLSAGLNEVAKLVQAKMRTDVLLSFIETSPTAFRLTADEIIHFQELGATPEIIESMIRRGIEVRAQFGEVNQTVYMPGFIQPATRALYDASPANLAYPAVQLDYNYSSPEVPFFVARPGYGYSYPVISSFLAPFHPATRGKPDSSSVHSAKAKADSQVKDFYRNPRPGYPASRSASSLPQSGYYQTWSGYSSQWSGYSMPWPGYYTPWKGYYTPWQGYYTPWKGFLPSPNSQGGLPQGSVPSFPNLPRSGQGQQVYSQPSFNGQARPGPVNSGSGFFRSSPNRGFLPTPGRGSSGRGGAGAAGRGGVAGMPARSGAGKG